MAFTDKSNLIAQRLSLGPISIELGVGQRKKNPLSIGIDVADSSACDVVGDAIEVLNSLPESCVNSVHASHFIEHVDSVAELLESLVRVCSKGAEIVFVAPHFSNPFFYSDPTHRSSYGLYTFSYYASSCLFSRTIPSYSRIMGLTLTAVTLRFSSYPPNYVRHFFKKLVQKAVNSTCWAQEFYEEVLCWLVPCYEIEYLLTIHK